eukprot:sb/3470803/
MVYLSDTAPNDSTQAIVTTANLKSTRMAMAYDEIVEKNKRSEVMIRQHDEDSMKKDDFLFEVMPPKIINCIRGGTVAFHSTIKVSYAAMITRLLSVDIGTVVAGIVGYTNPRYSIYGETVIYTQQLESASRPQRILISKAMKVALSGHREFRLRHAKNIALVGAIWCTSKQPIRSGHVTSYRPIRDQYFLNRSVPGAT